MMNINIICVYYLQIVYTYIVIADESSHENEIYYINDIY